MAEEIKRYSENSSLHIVRYIGDRNKPVLERIVWTVVLMLAVFAIVRYLKDDWTILRSGPLRVNVDDAGLSVGNVDFPSITICPGNVIHPTKLDQLVKRVLGSSAGSDVVERFVTNLRALARASYPTWRRGYNYLNSSNVTLFPFHNEDIIPFFKYLMTPINDIFFACFWRGSKFPCSEIFRVQSTEYGLCYSFNSFTGIRNYDDSPRKPPFINDNGELEVLRTNTEGRTNGLEIFLYDNQNSSDGETMYYSIVTKPHMYPPTLMKTPLHLQLKSVYHLEVQVRISSADESLNRRIPEALPCTLDNTVPYDNCLLKCRQHIISQECGCVLYTHAILLKLEDAKICGPQHLKCIAYFHVKLNQVQNYFKRSKGAKQCHCKPVCSDIIYLTRTEVLPRVADMYYNAVYMEVFYFPKWAIGYVTRSKMNLEDFIENIGGISGLYLGASFISLVEILVTFIKIIIFYLKRTKH